jgi:parvulin-like peptidyl-prolyl isomerase
MAKTQNGHALTKAERSEKMKWTIGVICIALVLALTIGLVAYNKVCTSGVIQRHTTSMSSAEGNYSVTESMLTYYFNSYYQNFISTYSSYLSAYGIDTTASLKTQTCPLYSDGTTWFDYFMSSTESSVAQILAYAECARAEGITLDDDDYAEIDDQIATASTMASAYSVSLNYYFSSNYGSSVNKSVVRSCLELNALATKYQSYLVDSYSFTDDEIQEYYDNNIDTFIKINYLSYDFEIDVDDDADDDTVAAAKEEARGYAEGLAATTTSEEYLAYVRAFVTKLNEDDEDFDVDEEMEDVTVTGATKGSDTVLAAAFEDDAEPYTVLTDYDDENGCYKVYMLLPGNEDSLPYAVKYRDEYASKSVRHILLTEDDYGSEEDAEAKAEEILATWQTGDATEESFAALAEEYSSDTGSNTEGGLYEDVLEGTMLTEFNDWIYDESRQPGDTGIVETTSGYHVMYFVGDGETAWKVTAENALANAKYSEDVEAALADHPSVYNEKSIANVVNVTYSSSSSST